MAIERPIIDKSLRSKTVEDELAEADQGLRLSPEKWQEFMLDVWTAFYQQTRVRHVQTNVGPDVVVANFDFTSGPSTD